MHSSAPRTGRLNHAFKFEIPYFLRSDARSWYDVEGGSYENFHDFASAFLINYSPVPNDKSILFKIDSKKQMGNETFKSHIYTLNSLFKQLNCVLSEQDKVYWVLNGLHPEYRDEIRGLHFDSLAELNRVMRDVEFIVHERRTWPDSQVTDCEVTRQNSRSKYDECETHAFSENKNNSVKFRPRYNADQGGQIHHDEFEFVPLPPRQPRSNPDRDKRNFSGNESALGHNYDFCEESEYFSREYMQPNTCAPTHPRAVASSSLAHPPSQVALDAPPPSHSLNSIARADVNKSDPGQTNAWKFSNDENPVVCCNILYPSHKAAGKNYPAGFVISDTHGEYCCEQSNFSQAHVMQALVHEQAPRRPQNPETDERIVSTLSVLQTSPENLERNSSEKNNNQITWRERIRNKKNANGTVKVM